MNVYMYLVVAMAVLLVFCLLLILALWARKEYYKGISQDQAGELRRNWCALGKYAKRITQLKYRLSFYSNIIKGQKDSLDQLWKKAKDDQEAMSALQETIKDYETIISMKDEELNEYDRAHPDAIIKETTKLIDRLRSVLIAKSGELRVLKGFLVRHGIDANAAIAEEPEMGASGAPYFSQIAEPDPDNNRPEIDGCEVCDQQLSTPALECEPQEATACC